MGKEKKQRALSSDKKQKIKQKAFILLKTVGKFIYCFHIGK